MKKFIILLFILVQGLVFSATKSLSDIKTVKFDVVEKTTVKSKKKEISYKIDFEIPNKIKKEVLHKLEFFYRNLGSIWSVEDFTNNRNVQSLLKDYLLVLEEKGIVKIIEGNKFKITNLPSSIMSRQSNSGTKE